MNDASAVVGPDRRRWPVLELAAAAGVVALLLRPALVRFFAGDVAQTWATMFVSLNVQALPFLVLGVVVSGAIGAFLPIGAVGRYLPRRASVAVPAASLAGILIPGCECSSVPVAGRLMARGAPAPAALAFMLAAPALNPVVLVATAVAFPGQPEVVLARFAASFLTATVVGLGWSRFAPAAGLEHRPAADAVESGVANRWEVFSATARHDFGHAGGFLALGAGLAATLQVVIPRSVLDGVGGSGPTAVLTLAVLAVLLAVCSEADAFVAASLVQFSPTARLAFMVVGPAVDLKLIALQAGTFGRPFAARFAPSTFAVAVISAVIVGRWFLLP